MPHNNATPHRHSLLLLKFSSYSPFGLFSFLPYLLLNFNALPVPTLTYRTFPKLTSLRAALRTSPIPSTDQPTIAFRIIGINPAPIVPCDPYSRSCHFAWVANVVWSADVAVIVPGDDILAVSGCSAAGGTLWWVGEGEDGVSSGRRRDGADGYAWKELDWNVNRKRWGIEGYVRTVVERVRLDFLDELDIYLRHVICLLPGFKRLVIERVRLDIFGWSVYCMLLVMKRAKIRVGKCQS